jgi:hypothetical protein
MEQACAIRAFEVTLQLFSETPRSSGVWRAKHGSLWWLLGRGAGGRDGGEVSTGQERKPLGARLEGVPSPPLRTLIPRAADMSP